MKAAEVFGRLLAIFDSIEAITPSMMSNYYKLPVLYMGLLCSRKFHKMSKTQAERVTVLFNYLSVEDMQEKIYSVAEQSILSIGYYSEKSLST